MVAAVLTMLWRDVAGVRELTRMLAREGFLWCAAEGTREARRLTSLATGDLLQKYFML